MKDLSVSQVVNAEFAVQTHPVLRPFDGSFIVADPSLLAPDSATDGLWHMFFHTNFGVYHFASHDGVNFEKVQKVVNRAMRPNINKIGDKYYLFYERTRSLLANALNVLNLAQWRSSIYVCQSDDLVHWSKPYEVLPHTQPFEKSDRGVALSNPFLLPVEGAYRLYYSCGLTYIADCKFCEPTYINYAVGSVVDGGYVANNTPILAPDADSPYLNLCSGCIKVYALKDGYIGVQNGIYQSEGASHSAIMLLTSSDGLKFDFAKILVRPDAADINSWMHQYVYASHLVRCGNTLRLYFNARDKSDMLKGRECIGFAEAAIE